MTPGVQGHAAGMRRLGPRLAEERGAALIMTLLVAMIVFGLGVLTVSISLPETRIAANYQNSVTAKYFAESAIERVVGLQNDMSRSPRYLFESSSYAVLTADSAVFPLDTAVAPTSNGNESAGTIRTLVTNTNPRSRPAPYVVRSTATLADGTSTTYEATVDVVSLLDFAVYSEADISIAPNITLGGRVYSGDDVSLGGPNIILLDRVEYVDNIYNTGYGDFRQGHERVPALPPVVNLADMGFYEPAAKNAGRCTDGRGLYIGTDGPTAVDNQSINVFARLNNQQSNSSSGCRDGPHCIVIDLGLFDFSASPITYNGVGLLGYDGNPLIDFNGIIFSELETHVWGHHGGRSVEDATIADGESYMTPPGVGTNLYSNNVLDAGEDGSNGGTANGQLDPRNVGANIGIYVRGNIYIDHNIFAGRDTAGNKVAVGLVARDNVHIDATSPRTIIIDAAVLAVTGTWDPEGSSSNHRYNYWANSGGTYVYDLDGDGTLETNTGVGQSGDRDETAMFYAWTLRNLGNLVTKTQPNSGVWSSNGHPRYYYYDASLQTAELPCYPTLPDYGIVPGSFTEVLVQP